MTLGSTTGRKKGRSSGSSSSRHVHHLSVARSSSGVASVRRETLTASSIQRQQQRERREYQELHGMTPAQKHELDAVQRNLAANLPNEDSAEGWEMDMQDVMSGEAVLDISHAGGEFADCSRRRPARTRPRHHRDPDLRCGDVDAAPVLD